MICVVLYYSCFCSVSSVILFFFKQKTAYEIVDCDWSSDVCSSDLFFIVVLFKKERLMMNVVRQFFMPRKTCPRPEYDQVVYKYNRGSSDLSFIWVIPDKQSCESIPLDILHYPKEQKEFLNYVMDFNSGKLDKLCDEINMKERIL